MLKDRILFTLKFFYMQQTPLTILELRDFLFNEPETLKQNIDSNFEIAGQMEIPKEITAEEIDSILQNELSGQVEQYQGFWCLNGSQALIEQRINNEIYHDQRERIIQTYLPLLKHVPFVRGAAVGGSHTLSQNKKESDIDLLMILEPEHFWLGRFLVIAYFQLTGHRRHGDNIANRFCLNHYLAGPIKVSAERDPYNAMEYLRLRPEVYGETITAFVRQNLTWISKFFPNAKLPQAMPQEQSGTQAVLESIFTIFFGSWLNRQLGGWQMRRIRRGDPPVANDSELSFHSKQRKFDFLNQAFGK